MTDVYTEHGFGSRKEYLESISEDSGVDISVVVYVADTLGPDEDFDRLIDIIDEISESGGY